jgi:hypothetical protein
MTPLTDENKIIAMKILKIIQATLCCLALVTLIPLAVLAQSCAMFCSGRSQNIWCADSPCDTNLCWIEDFPTGYTVGSCDNPYLPYEFPGCNDGWVFVNTTTYVGSCDPNCGCNVPPGSQPILDYGQGDLCWPEYCG